jgi:hypothetical protein
MLLSFAVKNYRGFAERICWNLTSPSNYAFNTYAIKDGVIKNGIIYGPNGSGKSNFALALFDIENHLSQKWKKPDYYSNFVTAGYEHEAVGFEYIFRFGSDNVEYSYQKDKDGKLITEKLIVNSNIIFDHDANTLVFCDEFPMDANAKDKLRMNVNGLSLVNFLTATYPLPDNHYLLELKKFADTMLWFKSLDKREFIGLETNATFLEEEIIKRGLVDDFKAFLLNVSGQEFEFAKPMEGEKVLKCIINGAHIPFSRIASTGTISLQVLYIWLNKMGRASFVFIDEFDAFYHFRLAYEVCRKLFELPCQVFLSSHNTYLMTNDLLRPDCNFILDHNIIKPLCDCTDKELRFGHNIEKLFRANAFSAL